MNRREFQKTSNIVRALSQYFLIKGCAEVTLVVRPSEDHCTITVAGSLVINEQELEELSGWLNQPKTAEMEYYYDDLLISALEDNELSLLGLMVDQSQVSYQDGMLQIKVTRYFRE